MKKIFKKIKDRMVEIINNDIVINKIKVKKEKAMEVFKSYGMKIRFLTKPMLILKG